jgi:Protein of unknown function (DUF3833)
MAQDMTTAVSSRFELTSFLEGRTSAWGIFEDRFGKLRRRFSVEMNGRWKGSAFHLDECFIYDTGERELRTWIVTPLGDGRFTATCPDCVGRASGECDDQSIRMRYRFRLRLGGRTINVSFDDRIYRMCEDIAVNRATMSKWGVKLGELSLFFRRQPDRAESPHDLAATRCKTQR